MKIKQLTLEGIELFINYCKKYREELSDEYISDAYLNKFYPDEENPTYVLLNDKDDIVGAISLIIDSYHREGKTGRFRIFHSSIPEKKCYELMFKEILKHTEGLNEIFLYIKDDDIKRAEILDMLNFKKAGYSFTLIRDYIEITEAEFPEGFELRTFKPSRDEADWCEVRNIGFPDDTPRTPENVCLYWEQDPDSHLEGGMLILYHNDKPVGTIRSSKEMENGEPYNFISVVCVNPEYRGRGFAKNMLRAALRFGKIKGLEKAMLCVDPDNPNAIDLYIKEGFKKISGAVAFSYDFKMGY